MTKAIYLHGRLGRLYGNRFDLDVHTPAEAIRALCLMLRGFRETLSSGSYRVVLGRMGLPIEGLHIRFGRTNELHIIPAAKGAKNSSGTIKVIAGVLLIAAAVFTYGTAIGWFGPEAAAFVGGAKAGFEASAIGVKGLLTASQMTFIGLGMVLGGVSIMLSPQPKASGPLTVDRNPSFLFSGPINSSAQGSPIPLIYGEVRVGSIVGATALKAEDYVANQQSNPVGDNRPGKLTVNVIQRSNIQ